MPLSKYAAPDSLAFEGLDHLVTSRNLILLALGLLPFYGLCSVVYNVFFHPLAKVPGPRLQAATRLVYRFRTDILGVERNDALEWHRKYGPIVRIAPDRVLVEGSIAWSDVFSPRGGGAAQEWLKEDNFFPEGKGGIIGADRDNHRRHRRILGHGFSDASLFEQEAMITTHVDLLIEQLTKRADRGEPSDIVQWLNFTTFDIIGDLVFADSFHSLENGHYHIWVEMLITSFRAANIQRFVNFYPYLRPLFSFTSAGKQLKNYPDRLALVTEKARARIAQGAEPGRRDFMTAMMKKTRDGSSLTEHEIFLDSNLLIVAGSETTATALSGLFFLICRNPTAYKRLADEVRTSFKSEEEINMRSSNHLPYLHAAIEESMRVYPPVVMIAPRQSPGTSVNGIYVPKGQSVMTSPFATFRNPKHFTEPESFQPERWLPASHPFYNSKFDNDNRAVFKPFSHGPRDCIGKNLAYAEMRFLLARLFYRFDCEYAGNMDDWMDSQRTFGVWEKPPLMIQYKRRV